MDPDSALVDIRNLIAALNGETDPHKAANYGEALAQKVQGLDGWLSRGGFLPHAWNGRRIGQ